MIVKPGEFPNKFNKQLIVDRRDGSVIESGEHDPTEAIRHEIGKLVLAHDTKESFVASFGEGAEEIFAYGARAMEAQFSLSAAKSPADDDGVIRCGPFEIRDACTHEKNAVLVAESFAELIGQMDSPTEEQAKLALWARDEFVPHVLGLKEAHAEVSVEGDMSGLPPELVGLFQSIGAKLGKNVEIINLSDLARDRNKDN